MNFAFLGSHSQARRVWSAIANHPDHALRALVGITDSMLAELLVAQPNVRVKASWQDLLGEANQDIVVVAGSDEDVQTGAKQLAADGRAICLVPAAAQGSAFIYELSLIHDDNRVPLIPLIPALAHALIDQLRTIIRAGELGSLMLLRLERTLPSDVGSGLLSRAALDAALLDDVLIMRELGGNYSRVNELQSGANDAGVSMATVTLSGEGLAEATIITRVSEPGWTLVVSGANGEAELKLDAQANAGTLKIWRKDRPTEEVRTADESGSQPLLIQQLTAGLAQSGTRWAELTRAFETVEATRASLRRRRTIDLVFESTSERSIFKSHMTAVGCGLLTLTLFGLVGFLLLGAFLDSRSMTQRTAAAEGRIIQTTEFIDSSLTDSGRAHVADLGRSLERAPGAVLVMPEESADALNRQRLVAVQDEFAKTGHAEAAALVEIAKTPNRWAQLLLQILRIVWIAPLAIFLGLQALLFLTRPASRG